MPGKKNRGKQREVNKGRGASPQIDHPCPLILIIYGKKVHKNEPSP
jgi:hypothetical protein